MQTAQAAVATRPRPGADSGNQQPLLCETQMSLEPTVTYEVPSGTLAEWVASQGSAHWWSVDGDPLLMGRLSFPCPGDELVEELRRIDRPLIVRGRDGAIKTGGEPAGAEAALAVLDQVADRDPRGDRVLLLQWKDEPTEWLLMEDTEAARNATGANHVVEGARQ
jgi:hypothetical protein